MGTGICENNLLPHGLSLNFYYKQALKCLFSKPPALLQPLQSHIQIFITFNCFIPVSQRSGFALRVSLSLTPTQQLAVLPLTSLPSVPISFIVPATNRAVTHWECRGETSVLLPCRRMQSSAMERVKLCFISPIKQLGKVLSTKPPHLPSSLARNSLI